MWRYVIDARVGTGGFADTETYQSNWESSLTAIIREMHYADPNRLFMDLRHVKDERIEYSHGGGCTIVDKALQYTDAVRDLGVSETVLDRVFEEASGKKPVTLDSKGNRIDVKSHRRSRMTFETAEKKTKRRMLPPAEEMISTQASLCVAKYAAARCLTRC